MPLRESPASFWWDEPRSPAARSRERLGRSPGWDEAHASSNNFSESRTSLLPAFIYLVARPANVLFHWCCSETFGELVRSACASAAHIALR